MPHPFLVFFFLWTGFAFSQVSPPLPDSTPPPLSEVGSSSLEGAMENRWEIEAAYQALYSGLPVADDLFGALLELPNLDAATRAELKLGQVAALLGEELVSEADAVLNSLQPDLLDENLRQAFLLRKGIVAYLLGREEQARESLAPLTPEGLDPFDRGWFFSLSGLLAEQGGSFMEAARLYEQARAVANSPFQRQVAESLIQRNLLLRGQQSEPLIRDLELLLEENRNSRLAVQYVQELAIALSRMGREAEALQVLADQINYTLPENEDQLDQLHLLSALIERERGRTGRRHLEWLLRFGENRNFQQVAIRYLLADAESNAEMVSLLEFFQNILSAKPSHPLAAEFVYTRAILLKGIGRSQEARALLNRLLSVYPGSSYSTEALRLLGYLALESREYRVAADTFSRLRNVLPPGPQRVEAGILQADAFFKNRDFGTAAQAYEAVFPDIRNPAAAEVILYQSVLSHIEAGNLDDARALLDSFSFSSLERESLHWEAEWNLIDALRRTDRLEQALSRVTTILESEDAYTHLSLLTMLRFLWAKALLALNSERFDSVEETTAEILESLVSEEATQLEKSLVDAITARTLLLLSQSHLQKARMEGFSGGNSPRVQEGFQAINRLERLYPDSEVTLQALFEKARFLREAGRAVDAQNIYLSIFQRDRESPYAPIALYEAAINSANLIALENPETLNVRNSEPIRLLNQLTENYQDNPQLFFFARLKQGDIARDLGQFGVAQSLYEEVIKQFTEHPQRYLPEIGRADSILAQASNDPGRYGEAAIAYERLMDRPGVPRDLKIEAGFKWAFALESQGNTSRSLAIHNLLRTRFLVQLGEGELMGPTGRYWMSRSLISAGQLFERSGNLRSARLMSQTLIDYGLPGRELARANLNRLGASPEVASSNPANP